jgi:hypothetical protein
VSALAEIRIPDLIGEIDAWRAWQIVGDLDLPRLESASQSASLNGADAIWPTNRWFLAKCLRIPEHNALQRLLDDGTIGRDEFEGIPVEHCSCGIYAAKTLEQLSRLHYGAYHDVADKVVGEVAFAGKLIEGCQGWRAEKARIKRLWLPHKLWRYAEPLDAAYGVEVGFARLIGGDGRIQLDGR